MILSHDGSTKNIQENRKELFFIIKMMLIFIKSLYIFIKEKPDVIISTGVLAAIHMLYIGHIFNKKVIYIESFAKTFLLIYIKVKKGRIRSK